MQAFSRIHLCAVGVGGQRYYKGMTRISEFYVLAQQCPLTAVHRKGEKTGNLTTTGQISRNRRQM